MNDEQRARFLVIHKSDASCLALLHAKLVEGIDSDNGPRRVGSAWAKAAEALAYEDEDGKTADEKIAVARETIESVAPGLKMTPEDVADALSIVNTALGPTSRLRFGRPSGWETSAEFQWALDKNWNAVPPGDPRAICGGTIDLAMWNDDGRAIAIDDKTTKGWQGHDDIQGFEAWIYVLAMMRIFGTRSAWFYYRNVRAGYRVGDEFRAGEAWEETVKSIVRYRRAQREAAVETDDFPETMGPDCKWCAIKHRCEAQKQAAREGREIPPDMPPDEIARRYLALKAMASAYETATKDIVKESGRPIDIGGGVSYGLKPVASLRLREKYEGPDGRARLVAMLKTYEKRPGQVDEAFRYVEDSGLASATKALVYELLDRDAAKFLDDVQVSPVEPTTKFENSAWMPTTGKRATTKTMDEMLDDLSW